MYASRLCTTSTQHDNNLSHTLTHSLACSLRYKQVCSCDVLLRITASQCPHSLAHSLIYSLAHVGFKVLLIIKFKFCINTHTQSPIRSCSFSTFCISHIRHYLSRYKLLSDALRKMFAPTCAPAFGSAVKLLENRLHALHSALQVGEGGGSVLG